MATQIEAIKAYCPYVKLGQRIEMDQLVPFIARSSGLNESGVRQVLLELRDAVVYFNRQGQAVKLDGLGTYTPKISLDGTLGVAHRTDIYIKNHVNVPGEFSGHIENAENIGQTSEELIDRWNEEHPEDPVA